MSKKKAMPWKWRFPVVSCVDNYDGDTFFLELDVGFHQRHYEQVRLANVDTPEMRGGTDATKAAARLAKEQARALIDGANVCVFECTKWGGKYGRPVGNIEIDGSDLGERLIEEGLAIKFFGNAKERLVLHKENAKTLKNQGRI